MDGSDGTSSVSLFPDFYIPVLGWCWRVDRGSWEIMADQRQVSEAEVHGEKTGIQVGTESLYFSFSKEIWASADKTPSWTKEHKFKPHRDKE